MTSQPQPSIPAGDATGPTGPAASDGEIDRFGDGAGFPGWPRALALGFVAGLLSGLFGVGGGVILVPLMVMAFHFAQKRAQATSLVAIILTAASGAVAYVIAGQYALVPALFIAAGGIAGSYLGAALAHRGSENQIRVIFAVVMVASAVRMLWPVGSGDGHVRALTVGIAALYVLTGLAMGTLSALVGVGGGIILVPILVLAFSFQAQTAQGTSLLVMVPISMMGAWRNSKHGYTDWRTGLLLGVGGVIGSPLGSQLAFALPSVWLQRLFAALLIFSAAQMTYKLMKSRPAGG